MFTKEAIKQIVTDAGLTPDDCVLYTGNSLVMHGLRETTNDIDLGVTPEVFEELHMGEEITIAKWSDCRTFKMGDIEVFEVINVSDVPSTIIDGIRVQSLDSILEWKQRGGRPKDLEDIELILKMRA